MYKNSYINNFVKSKCKNSQLKHQLLNRKYLSERLAKAGVHCKEKWNIQIFHGIMNFSVICNLMFPHANACGSVSGTLTYS